MFRIPVYTLQNYRTIIGKGYGELSKDGRENFGTIVSKLTPKVLKTYEHTDARKIDQNEGGDIVSLKLLFPTLRNCEYFFRNTGKGMHHGIDIILPKDTPIISFSAGIVTKVKTRDGSSKDEGNCITIKSPAGYRSYEHCQEILVSVGEYIEIGQKIATVGSTGNSTQYHLHLQCDRLDAPFHPYYTTSLQDLQRYTLNPLPLLKQVFGRTGIFYDMPTDLEYKKAIEYLYEQDILSGHQGYVRPMDFLQRYEFALLVYRTLGAIPILLKHLHKNNDPLPYQDIQTYSKEVQEALTFLYQYGIMTGHRTTFSPHKNIKGHEVLAVLGRIFFQLENASSGHRYQSYLSHFISMGIIPPDWEFVGMPILRQEVFRLLSKLLQHNIIT